ncbi:MAG: peptide-methionine (S)-S-oxide reductase MsrA [Atopobiaceae bacterium]|nr:peptide-methionine (S)-S-oxide reductase MsrA [Atopobiaceae bacterium]
MNEIYLAGGCFWGVEEYFSRIPGVTDTTTGYANGHTANPTYQDVCTDATGYAETVHVVYDPERVSLQTILEHYFMIIDPLSVNRQGGDSGTQYRTGVYYVDEASHEVAREVFAIQQLRYHEPMAVELEPLTCFYPAEEYHQDYLKKNPGGYCHVSFDSLGDLER